MAKVELYRSKQQNIVKAYIEIEKVNFIFHPYSLVLTFTVGS